MDKPALTEISCPVSVMSLFLIDFGIFVDAFLWFDTNCTRVGMRGLPSACSWPKGTRITATLRPGPPEEKRCPIAVEPSAAAGVVGQYPRHLGPKAGIVAGDFEVGQFVDHHVVNDLQRA